MADFTNVQSQTTGERNGESIEQNCFFSLGIDVSPAAFSNSFLIYCLGNKSPWCRRVPTPYLVVLTLGTMCMISSLLVEFSVKAAIVHLWDLKYSSQLFTRYAHLPHQSVGKQIL